MRPFYQNGKIIGGRRIRRYSEQQSLIFVLLKDWSDRRCALLSVCWRMWRRAFWQKPFKIWDRCAAYTVREVLLTSCTKLETIWSKGVSRILYIFTLTKFLNLSAHFIYVFCMRLGVNTSINLLAPELFFFNFSTLCI